jgi:hypothetical protein
VLAASDFNTLYIIFWRETEIDRERGKVLTDEIK